MVEVDLSPKNTVFFMVWLDNEKRADFVKELLEATVEGLGDYYESYDLRILSEQEAKEVFEKAQEVEK